jgi:hypothetical protein
MGDDTMKLDGPTTDHAEIQFWAETHQAIPTEILPAFVDHVPTVLQIMLPQMAQERPDVRVMTWEEFFTKFDLLGLSFVYDSTGYNELLQIDDKSPYRSPGELGPIDRNN